METGQINVRDGLVQEFGLDCVVAELVRQVQFGILSFPYKQTLYDIDVLRSNLALFNELELVVDSTPYIGAHTTLLTPFIDFQYVYDDGHVDYYTIGTKRGYYETLHILADVFAEPVRLRARKRKDPCTPIQQWIQNPEPFLRACYETHRDFGAYHLREIMFPALRECETFKTDLAYLIYRIYRATHVLDFCAGWGDRLVAAIAAGISYTGVDANPDMQKIYRDIINTYFHFKSGTQRATTSTPSTTSTLSTDLTASALTTSTSLLSTPATTETTETTTTLHPPAPSYVVHGGDFLECKLAADASFDLVFTCPPYFDNEVYCLSHSQSIVRFPGLNAWFNGFLCASLRKAWHFLRPGGHMVIVLNDCGNHCYCEAMVLYCQARLPNCSFRGTASYARVKHQNTATNMNTTNTNTTSTVHQPMWVFLKEVEEEDAFRAGRREIAEWFLLKNYSRLLKF